MRELLSVEEGDQGFRHCSSSSWVRCLRRRHSGDFLKALTGSCLESSCPASAVQTQVCLWGSWEGESVGKPGIDQCWNQNLWFLSRMCFLKRWWIAVGSKKPLFIAHCVPVCGPWQSQHCGCLSPPPERHDSSHSLVWDNNNIAHFPAASEPRSGDGVWVYVTPHAAVIEL